MESSLLSTASIAFLSPIEIILIIVIIISATSIALLFPIEIIVLYLIVCYLVESNLTSTCRIPLEDSSQVHVKVIASVDSLLVTMQLSVCLDLTPCLN